MKKKYLTTCVFIATFAMTGCAVPTSHGETPKVVEVESISLNSATLSLEVEQTYNLTFTINPTDATDKTVTWSSSNSTVASVNNGVVTALSAGSTDVTATTKNGKSATCAVTVKNKTVEVTGVSFDITSKTLTEGDDFVITATVTPDNATNPSLTWTSSNSNVATVSNGKVTAVKEGTTTITAKSNNNKTATCEVTVNKAVTPDYSSTGFFSLSKSSTLTVGSYVLFASGSTGSVKAMSTQGTNNRSSASATATDGMIERTESSTYRAFKVEKGTVNGTYAFYDVIQKGYLYAASSTGNQLKTQSTLDANGSFTVSDSNGEKTLVAQGSNSKKYMRWNSSSSVFACYSQTSTVKNLVYIFENVGEPVYPTDFTHTTPTNNKLAVGDTFTIDVSYTNSEGGKVNVKKASFTSSDITVASISSEGLITAKKAGQTTIDINVASSKTETIKKSFTLTVSNVAVTGVTLNKSTLEIGEGRSDSLTATVTPNNATNKSVTWSSSKTSVATVNNGTINAVSQGTTTITVTTVDGGFKATAEVTVTEAKGDAWTILVYICGADLESGGADDYGKYSQSDANKYGAQASADISEMLSVSGQPDDVNVVLETGGAGIWASAHGIKNNELGRYHIANKSLVKDGSVTKASMGLQSTLQSFITWGIQTYPAQKYGLILWNHGGAMEGCCYDELFNGDSLSNKEVYDAVNGAKSTLGITGNLEFIGYDCCLMQVQDIAEFNSKNFNYMVASEESEAGSGWDYDVWFKELYKYSSTETILQSICHSFVEENNVDLYGNYDPSASDQCLSFLDLSKMADYKTAWENLAKKMSTVVNAMGDESDFQSFMKKKVYSYGNAHYTNQEYQALLNAGYIYEDDYSYDEDIGYYCDLSNGIERFGTFDVVEFLTAAEANSAFSTVSSEISAAKTAVNQLIKFSECGGRAKSHGLAFVYSYDSYTDRCYKSNQTNFTNWFNFNTQYGA